MVKLAEAGLNKSQLSELAGFKPSEMTRYLQGDTQPRLHRIEAMANALNCRVEAICDESEEDESGFLMQEIEIEFSYSGIQSISRDGRRVWETTNAHVRSETPQHCSFELPYMLAPIVATYIADGAERKQGPQLR